MFQSLLCLCIAATKGFDTNSKTKATVNNASPSVHPVIVALKRFVAQIVSVVHKAAPPIAHYDGFSLSVWVIRVCFILCYIFICSVIELILLSVRTIISDFGVRFIVAAGK